jgi:succinate dehydrogenase/fumarate reductase cytochrome b subunit (b558 family)
MAIFSYLKSTILSKIVMAVTGVLLVLYIIGHTVGNMQVYLGPDPLNTYAHFLQSLGEGLWIIRIVLGIALILHIITSIKLKLHNMGAKPDKYQVKNYVRATLTSRTMIWTGIMIFAFLVFHLAHFTTGDVNSEDYAKNHPEYYKGDIHLAKVNSSGEYVPMIPCCDDKDDCCDKLKTDCCGDEKTGKPCLCKDEILEKCKGKVPDSCLTMVEKCCEGKLTADEFKELHNCCEGNVSEDCLAAMKNYHDCCGDTKTVDRPLHRNKNKAGVATGILYERPDVYYMVVKSFQKWWISLAYIIGVILLGFHLNHAIQSMLQTLGLNHPKYFNCFVNGSTWLSIIIVLCLISIPITIFTGLVGGCL